MPAVRNRSGAAGRRDVRYDARGTNANDVKTRGDEGTGRDFFVAISREKFNLLNRREGQSSYGGRRRNAARKFEQSCTLERRENSLA